MESTRPQTLHQLASRSPDVERLVAAFVDLFGREPDAIASAPGRLEFIGNHIDYNGGPVLGVAIDRRVTVGLARRSDGIRCFATTAEGQEDQLLERRANANGREPGQSWINYPLGVINVLPKFGLHQPQGFDMLVHSTLPAGAGLSSSAALEVASTLAFLSMTGQTEAPWTVVQIAHHAENSFVGVPCGLLDQSVVTFGRADSLVHIECRDEKITHVELPPGLAFWVFNTRIKHSLVDGLYAERHTECSRAAAILGVQCLANAKAAQIAEYFPNPSEQLGRRARHVVDEVGRVRAVRSALMARNISMVGRLLTYSHRSSQHLFENSIEELDFLVDVLCEQSGVFGARLTGGGFGGAVFALTSEDFTIETARLVAAAFERKFGSPPDVLALHPASGAFVHG